MIIIFNGFDCYFLKYSLVNCLFLIWYSSEELVGVLSVVVLLGLLVLGKSGSGLVLFVALVSSKLLLGLGLLLLFELGLLLLLLGVGLVLDLVLSV